MSMNKPYLVDAIIGNSAFLASLGRNGRMYRLWWPNIDTPQHVDAIRTGIKLGSNDLTWFDSEAHGWTHEASYMKRTNIYTITARSEQLPVVVDSQHFAIPEHDVIVRSYTFTNISEKPVSFDFVMHSSFYVGDSPLFNTTFFHEASDALIHYRHRYFFALSGANACAKFQAGADWDTARKADLNGNPIDMSPDGAMSWQIDELAPGASVSVPIYMAAGHNEPEALHQLSLAKSRTAHEWAEDTVRYWNSYVDAATPCPSKEADIIKLYERSVLMFKLMSDDKTGSIIAAPEFDEHFSRCGGYSFCWGRDAAFITAAFDRAGLSELSDRFYAWTLSAQSPDGSWQQRHYHDGSLAPSWGLQIDEGASILWGMWQHYSETQDHGFAAKVWPSVERGARFLVSFIDDETSLPKPSIDLWEERNASHTYSSAAVYGGLTAAASFAKLADREDLTAEWSAAAAQISAAIVAQHWNEDRGCFYRGINLAVSSERYERELAAGNSGHIEELTKGYKKHRLDYDSIIDVSLLGVSVPFNAVDADHEYMARTADAIEAALTVPEIGGILRYEDDIYAGGNSWILTTLWLAHYRIQTGKLDDARRLIRWAIDHRTESGLLPEQIDKHTGDTAWVVPLTWSHAMFVLAIFMLADAEAAELNVAEASSATL